MKTNDNVKNYKDVEEDVLLNRCLRGEGEYFGEIFNRHFDGMVRFVFYMINDLPVAKDIVQDTFLKAYKNLKTLKDLSKFKSWLIRIARNKCIDHLRRLKKEREIFNADAEFDYLKSDEKKPEEELMSLELFQVVKKHINNLPEDLREVIILKYTQDLSYKEIADVIGTSVSAVESRLFRARQRLKGRLEKYL